jgi:membrane fusion protein, multidrug efflux system
LRFGKLTDWIKRHLLISTALVVVAVYLLFEVVTTFVVFCRDAYITTDIVIIAPDVGGPMKSLEVSNDQAVQAGDLLFTIDPEPFQIEWERQKAALDVGRATLQRAKDQLAVTNSGIEGKRADLNDASQNQQRGLELLKSKDLSPEGFDELQRAFQVAEAAWNRARAESVLAEQETVVRGAEIKQIEAALAKAEYELARTQVRSPIKGRVAPFQLRPGTILEAGKPVLALVSAENWRVVANLTERHIGSIEPGQKVFFIIGSDPWRVHLGQIKSIAPGIARSAAAVNVLPYVEPNTDWIRLPRRFPVEIDVGDLPKTRRLFMGANATVWWIHL